MDLRSSQATEQIRSRLPLRELVGRYVALKPAGKGRWKGLCPFHQEKTPSFHVDENKGFFHCFGCKAGGDLFKFMELIEGIDFRQALERLAHETGVELPASRPEGSKKELLEVIKLAQDYFRKSLQGGPLQYLENRGLKPESIERFGLGYAPQSRDGLLRHLQAAGVGPEEGLAAGVLAEREGRFFDRFRNRVTFPLHDPLGRTVAFTARALTPEEQPKYLNSPETALFKKSLLLYGLPQARHALRDKKRAVVVEGLFDVIALHQLGFEETVGVLGSSLSSEQAHLLRRHEVAELYLAFDADEAGRKATLQSLGLEIVRSFLVYAVLLEGGKDPGDLLLAEDGLLQFKEFLQKALPEVEFRFQSASENQDLKTPAGKRAVLEALAPRMISSEPFDPVVERLKALVVGRLGLEARALEDFLASGKKVRSDKSSSIAFSRPDLLEKRLLLELDLIAQILSVPEDELATWVEYVEDHTWPPEGSLLAEFASMAKTEKSSQRIIAHFERRGEGSKLLELLVMGPGRPLSELQSSMERSMARLREIYLMERLERLKAQLHTEADNNILREIHEVQRAIEAERRVYKR